jgi:hypothetical protein
MHCVIFALGRIEALRRKNNAASTVHSPWRQRYFV